jgi:hypothetical protein
MAGAFAFRVHQKKPIRSYFYAVSDSTRSGLEFCPRLTKLHPKRRAPHGICQLLPVVQQPYIEVGRVDLSRGSDLLFGAQFSC